MIIDAAGPQGLVSKRCVSVAVFQSGANAALGFHYLLQVVIKPKIERCKLPVIASREDEEEIQEVAGNLAAAKVMSVDAAPVDQQWMTFLH